VLERPFVSLLCFALRGSLYSWLVSKWMECCVVA
jgi:hypothetical protein